MVENRRRRPKSQLIEQRPQWRPTADRLNEGRSTDEQTMNEGRSTDEQTMNEG